MTIEEIQNEIIEEFELFDDWMARYEHIIELGKELPSLDDKYKVSENLVKGCQSQVWLHAYMDGEKLIFQADSDAMITKGLVALMVRVLSNHKPEAVANTDLHFIDKIGLKEHLSPTRSNGLVSMIKKMKMYGLAFTAKQEG